MYKKPKFNLANVLKRIKLPTPILGKLVQGVGLAVGIGGVTATASGYFTLTGDTAVDIVSIICTTLIIVFGGKYPVYHRDENKLEH